MALIRAGRSEKAMDLINTAKLDSSGYVLSALTMYVKQCSKKDLEAGGILSFINEKLNMIGDSFSFTAFENISAAEFRDLKNFASLICSTGCDLDATSLGLYIRKIKDPSFVVRSFKGDILSGVAFIYDSVRVNDNFRWKKLFHKHKPYWYIDVVCSWYTRGTLFMNRVIEEAKQSGIKTLILESVNNSAKFYEKLGFVKSRALGMNDYHILDMDIKVEDHESLCFEHYTFVEYGSFDEDETKEICSQCTVEYDTDEDETTFYMKEYTDCLTNPNWGVY